MICLGPNRGIGMYTDSGIESKAAVTVLRTGARRTLELGYVDDENYLPVIPVRKPSARHLRAKCGEPDRQRREQHGFFGALVRTGVLLASGKATPERVRFLTLLVRGHRRLGTHRFSALSISRLRLCCLNQFQSGISSSPTERHLVRVNRMDFGFNDV